MTRMPQARAANRPCPLVFIRRRVLFAIAFAGLCGLSGGVAGAQPAEAVKAANGQIRAITPDAAVLTIEPDDRPGDLVPVNVKAPELVTHVKSLGVGDVVRAEVSDTAAGPELRSIRRLTVPVSPGRRLATFLLAALAVLLVGGLLLRFRLLEVIRGADGYLSKSKFQMALWFTTLVTIYVAVVGLRAWASNGRLVDDITIPQNLLLVSGLSGLTFVGAKQIRRNKEQRVDAAGLTREVGPPSRFPDDLINDNEGSPDFADFQMVLITLVAVGTYAVSVWNWVAIVELAGVVTLPDIDTTILTFLGVGQGAYLIKKQVDDAGGEPPVPAAAPSGGTPVGPDGTPAGPAGGADRQAAPAPRPATVGGLPLPRPARVAPGRPQT